MVTATAEPGTGGFAGRRRKSARLAAGAAARLASGAARPHKAALRRLADMPLTVLGGAGVDFAAFHIAHGWGWLVTGLSLVVIEHLIADQEET